MLTAGIQASFNTNSQGYLDCKTAKLSKAVHLGHRNECSFPWDTNSWPYSKKDKSLTSSYVTTAIHQRSYLAAWSGNIWVILTVSRIWSKLYQAALPKQRKLLTIAGRVGTCPFIFPQHILFLKPLYFFLATLQNEIIKKKKPRTRKQQTDTKNNLYSP